MIYKWNEFVSVKNQLILKSVFKGCVCLKGSSSEKRKNVFYFTLKALFVPEIVKF